MSQQRSLPEVDLPAVGDADGAQRNGSRARSGRLSVHDPFDLIRWLAMSQPDPRKAVAELVQNALDAGARRISVVRARRRRVRCLTLLDDGGGVIPELPLDEALRYLATHIGHSRKRRLTPRQRHELMTQGQYGIGLLGFWSLGETLEIRSYRAGERPLRLILRRDRPEYRIEGIPGAKPSEQTKTEVVVSDLHREAMPVLGARRLGDYLATELRGQLLARDVELSIEDRLARGRGRKSLRVSPLRFAGVRFDLDELTISTGEPPVRLDLFVAPGGSSEPVALYAAGTLVATSFAELGHVGLDHAPWTDPRLTGVVDYPLLPVAPGSRRGVLPGAAASALRQALATIEPRLRHFLDREEEQRNEELDRPTMQRLRTVFHDVLESLPRYGGLPTERAQHASKRLAEEGSRAPDADGSLAGDEQVPAEGETADSSPPSPAEPPRGDIELLESSVPPIESSPTGPLDSVRIVPSSVTMTCGSSRWLRAEVLDEDGRLIDGTTYFLWRLVGLEGELERQQGTSPRVRLKAGITPGSGSVRVVAEAPGGVHDPSPRVATCEIPVEIRMPSVFTGPGEAIPEPELVHEPGAAWRSRLQEDRWEVNTAHPSYREVADQPGILLRYLALLLAKEVVLHSCRDPRAAEPLEDLVEVFSAADRLLTKRPTR